MLSPSPTQQPPKQIAPEQKKIRSTPARKQPGQSPTAKFIKAVFRPILKGLYYLLQGIRKHIALTIAILLLLTISMSLTNYFTTGQFPFGIGNDQFNFHVHGTNGGGDRVKNWVYHLRQGNVAALGIDEKDMSQPPDPNQLVKQYSQSNNLIWKDINVVGFRVEPDTTIDSFVEVDVVTNGPGGGTKGTLLWHFVTVSQGGGLLLNAELVGGQIRPAVL